MKTLANLRWPALAGVVAVAAALLAGPSAGAEPSGSAVAAKLAQVSTAVGGLSGSVRSGGSYGQEPNAGAVPFLGGAPGSLLSGVFEALGPLSGFNGFTADDDALVRVVDDKVKAVAGSLGSGQLTGTYTCGAAACKLDEDKVESLTSVELGLEIGGSKSGDVDFTSLGLPSMGFLPKNAGKLNVQLSWSVGVRLIADGNGLRLAPAANGPELTLAATIGLPTESFTVNLGALVVKATEKTEPRFSGSLLVEVDENGALRFGFGSDSGFEAAWHFETTDESPLGGIEADLEIDWALTGQGVAASGLSIDVTNVKIDTKRFVGDDLQAAAASVSEVTHPLRTATSPLSEPIPGLSDLASSLGGDDVTMLTIMEEWQDFPPQVRELLTRLRQLDDVVSALEGDGVVQLGSFSLTGGGALKPVRQPLAEQAIQGLKKIYDECDKCKETVDELLAAVGGPGAGAGGFQFDLPVLRDPPSLAGLLLGRDVDLITFDTGQIGYPKTRENIPIARFFIFAAKLAGDLQATIHIKGGVDTRGIIDALTGSGADVLNGVYLQRPADGDPVVRVLSDVSLAGGVDIEVAEATLGGGPKPDIALVVPESAPDAKLRPTVEAGAVTNGIGCALLEDGKADFSVHVTATFDYFFDSEVQTLAEHTFLTRADLCDENAKNVPVAEADGRSVRINPAGVRGIPAGEPDTITVFMTHHPNGDPDRIVVTGNNNQRKDFPAGDFDNVRYEAPNDDRPVIFRAVRTDEKPFEKTVYVETGDGHDDVLVDSQGFGLLVVNDGDDKVMVGAVADDDAAGKIVSGGPGNDRIIGGDQEDILGGGEGHDTVDGAGGFDILTGGAGNDILLDSSPDGNCLSGNEGDDLIVDGPGADFLNGDEAFCGPGAERDPEDPGATGGGKDTIVTGGGADVVVAGDGNDRVRLHGEEGEGGSSDAAGDAWAAGVTVHGNGGNDLITTGTGDDRIHGGPGSDDIAADAGAPRSNVVRRGGNDTVFGGLGEDKIDAGDGIDTVYGDNGIDTCVPPIAGQPPEADSAGAADEVYGGDGSDRIALEAGDDTAYGNDGDDIVCGHAGADTVYGDGGGTALLELGAGSDLVFGGSGDDTIAGGPSHDELFGNGGSDTIDGDDGDDRIVGGSSAAGTADGADTVDGGGDADVVVGDNGTISDAWPRVPSVFDLFAGDATLGAGDTIEGGTEDDRVFGGIGNDTIRGDDGDDHLEGNSGDDAVHGGGGQDDVIGGTSPESLPNPAAGRTAADAPDGGETILSGGTERDVVLGDNGIITRPGGVDPITGGAARAVTLLDRERTGAALAAVSGGDYIEGNEERDRLYGEGGDDYIKGNEGDDYAEGNQGADRLEGNGGEDDLIGGSSFASAPGVGDPDAGDRLAGGAGADVLLGDNAVVSRATTGSGAGFDWDTVANSWLGPSARRSITLLDKAALAAANFGDDVLSGGAGEDVAFGQDGGDHLYGGPHDDYLEGNGGSDVLYGDGVAPATGDLRESGQPQLDGGAGPDGQDDQIGGSSWAKATAGSGAVTGQRDGADVVHGDGNADVQLGDNGRVLRRIVDGSYRTYLSTTGKPTIVRQAAATGSPATALPARFDVGSAAAAGVWGADTLFGNDGDDLQLGQDGDDTLYGGAGDDDMYGELGADRLFGEAGEDAMLGDRGVITNLLVNTPGATISITGPPRFSFTPYAAHPLDRRVDMNDDGDGAPLQSPGMTSGGPDFMRGGPDHDSMHGEAGNDLMNGDSGGDYLFGDDGADVMFGGKGRDCADPADLACADDRGANDRHVDYLFGGHGLQTDPITGGADMLDFRPRPGVDPASWFELTSTGAGDAVADHQHHQGIDWIYGGWDRDVMQANVADNGPNDGDRLVDWTGAYNLYTHCPAAYGGFNDVRQLSPSLQGLLENLAYSLGAGKSLRDVQTKGTSGYRELALVYSPDVKTNSGTAYPTTPGHFHEFSCAP